MKLKLKDIPGVMNVERGLPRADWSRLNRYLAGRYANHELARAYRAAEQDFVAELAWALNRRRSAAPYRLVAGRNFDLLSSARERTLKGLLDFAEDTRRRILRALKGVAADDGYGAHVVLLFSDDGEYRRYSAGYGTGIGAGREAQTVGFYTNDGFGHFAIRHRGAAGTRRILAHELVHACMQHLPAPDWLHEGTACMLERVFGFQREGVAVPDAGSLPGRASRKRLASFWNSPGPARRRNRNAFWTGRGFYEGGSARADLVRENCFALAEGLTAWLYARRRSDFLSFAGRAHRRDGGRAELRSLLADVKDPVDFFLGEIGAL